jgi:hypothetical protein
MGFGDPARERQPPSPTLRGASPAALGVRAASRRSKGATPTLPLNGGASSVQIRPSSWVVALVVHTLTVLKPP